MSNCIYIAKEQDLNRKYQYNFLYVFKKLKFPLYLFKGF